MEKRDARYWRIASMMPSSGFVPSLADTEPRDGTTSDVL